MIETEFNSWRTFLLRQTRFVAAMLVLLVMCATISASFADEEESNDDSAKETTQEPGQTKVEVPAKIDPLDRARQLELQGKHDEAIEAYQQILKTLTKEKPNKNDDAKSRIAALIGQLRTLNEVGKVKEMYALLESASQAERDGPLASWEAQIAWDSGDFKNMDKKCIAAINHDANNFHARWLQFQFLRAIGKLDEANNALRWFVKQYNDGEVKDPESLRYIGLASAEFARWNRLSDQFSFLVNEFYPDLLKLEPEAWFARYEMGCLFAEKYNEPEAKKQFDAALAMNPHSANLQVVLALMHLEKFDLAAAQKSLDRAEKINPRNVSRLQVQALLHLHNVAPGDALKSVEAAMKINPHDETTLGLLAACYVALDGFKENDTDSRFAKLEAEIEKRNPHAGTFYKSLGDGFDALRKFPLAERFYRKGLERMPQMLSLHSSLGMMLMRLGEEAEARDVLKRAFEIDPFHVRVSNMLKVLELLEGYATIETDHFIIRFDRTTDEVFARMAASHLEENVWPEITEKLGYEPKEKSLFEFFNRSKGTDAQGWFSARMVGLPFTGLIGACAGKVVAMQSPIENRVPFNWAQVLKHEFVHVVNLQQTDFNIPHWYTEGLAVYCEGPPSPAFWPKLLSNAHKEGELLNLETIDAGFIRPKSGTQRQLAYHQAELYCHFMVEKFGPDSLAKMIASFANRKTTAEGLVTNFHVKQADFEKEYRAFIEKRVVKWRLTQKGTESKESEQKPTSPFGKKAPTDKDDDEPESIADLEAAVAKNPNDVEVRAKLAERQYEAKELSAARKSALAVLNAKPSHPGATLTLSKLEHDGGNLEQAIKLLDPIAKLKRPPSDLLWFLAALKTENKDAAGASALYELGAKEYPEQSRWAKQLTLLYLKSGDDKKLGAALEKLVADEPDNVLLRKKLAQLAEKRNDYAAMNRWAWEVVSRDPMDVNSQRTRAVALTNLKKSKLAAEAWELVLLIEPHKPDDWAASVAAHLANGDEKKAVSAAKKLQELEPTHESLQKPAIKTLLEKSKSDKK